MNGKALAYKLQKLRLLVNTVVNFIRFLFEERRRGTLLANLKGFYRQRRVVEEMSWADLLEERARQVPFKKFLLYKDEEITYRQMDDNANRVANFLLKLGGGKGKGIGILMRNSPRFLDVFFGAQKIGMYLVPINSELKGDGLAYVINHSDIEFLAMDAKLIDSFKKISDQTDRLKTMIVNDIEEEAQGHEMPEDFVRLSTAYGPDSSSANPGIGYNAEDICMIMYTSGTTGRPKGVVSRYNRTNVKMLCLAAGITLKENDVYYTAFALCHGNALYLTVTVSMAVRATVALSRKFSASRFWDDIRRYKVTVFNTLGSVIPILMKQPEMPSDRRNNVRYVLSAACPAQIWEAFERRFKVKLYEGYGAVDGGGKGILNFGTAPVGSIGKPSAGLGKVRLVDEQGNEVPIGEAGELIFEVGKGKSSVEYYKNEQATNEKVKDGWLYTGDLVKKDEDRYLYFVGRNTESMRRGGENVSAYEVEHVIMKHPAVEEAAVYAVPSELAEDEIMASVKLVEGKDLQPRELIDFLGDKLAKFAMPRYIRIVEQFPTTSTHRIIKKEIERDGVTEDTYDARSA